MSLRHASPSSYTQEIQLSVATAAAAVVAATHICSFSFCHHRQAFQAKDKKPWTPARAPTKVAAAKMHLAEAEATGNLLGLDLANTSVIPGLMLRDDFFQKPLEPRYVLPPRQEQIPDADVQFHIHRDWKKSAPPTTPGW
jgi:hypothetical protein